MADLSAIFVALDYIEDHLQQDITIVAVAEAASYSLFHFCRAFNRTLRHTPYDYLMRRRLSEAARELVETDRKVIDVALDYAFKNPETFSRAFKRMFGVQPVQWRRQGDMDRRRLLSKPTRAYVEYIASGDVPGPVVEPQQAVHLAGLMALIRNADTVTVSLWELLEEHLAGAPGLRYGVTWYPPAWERRGRFYMAAVAVDASVDAEPALALRNLPAGDYARLAHHGPRDTLQFARDYLYQTWLPQSGACLAYPIEVECYGSGPYGADSATVLLLPVE